MLSGGAVTLRALGRAAAPRTLAGALAVVALAGASLFAATQSKAQRVAPCTGGPTLDNVVAPVLPRAFDPESVQAGADCVAWQEFIYLNWQADPARPGTPAAAPASAFGTPGVTTPTVWQTFSTAPAVFDPATRAARSTAPGTLLLRETRQTGGGWLTTQSGSPTYYEVRINQDEADYITENGLTTFAGQAACVQGTGGLNLPHGGSAGRPAADKDTDCQGNVRRYGQDVGAIEIKAAWIVLPADGSLDARYEIARATVTDPSSSSTRQATVGLVGLHIVHKLPGATQLMWETFEQIDNAPDAGSAGHPVLPANAPAPLPGYTYYDAACVPATDAHGCVANARPAARCLRLQATPPPGCPPRSAPVQVTRLTPITAEVDDATARVWGAIQHARAPGSPLSVFNYYRLVDVQWPAQDVAPVPPRARLPLPAQDMIPTDSTRYVANATMETFVQQTRSCLDCHQNAAIARPPAQPVPAPARALTAAGIRQALRGTTAPGAPTPAYASDYSFVFAAETRR